mgnify:CR=1 FL=1|tara:strand:+ start:312 stop:908 length:597 start_codon:yes stop_codon:yes gene_type:complete
MNDTSGPTLPTPLAYLDPDGSSWRMSQDTLLSEDQPLLERLPNWGIAQDSVLYQLAQPEHLTNANDFSSLPTPTARDYKDTGPNTNYEKIAAKKRLAGTIALLPTPNAGRFNDSETPENWQARKNRQNNYAGTPLPVAVKMLPTPRAQNGEDRNMNIWERPLDQPQNLENALARLTGENTEQPSTDGNTSLDDQPRLL